MVKDVLKRLAGKVAKGLSVIVRSIVGATLSFLGKAVGFVSKHTWALIDYVEELIGVYLCQSFCLRKYLITLFLCLSTPDDLNIFLRYPVSNFVTYDTFWPFCIPFLRTCSFSSLPTSKDLSIEKPHGCCGILNVCIS